MHQYRMQARSIQLQWPDQPDPSETDSNATKIQAAAYQAQRYNKPQMQLKLETVHVKYTKK